LIRTLFMLMFWGLSTLIVGPPGLLIALVTGNARPLYWMATRLGRLGVQLAGVRIGVIGSEHLQPGQNYIFMSNHVSNLDPPVLIPLLPGRTSVLVKQELFRIPILGFAMRVAHLVPVDRRNRDAAIASVRAAADVIRSGLNMTIFPEGTRSLDGRLQPLKKGPFYLAIESGCPIVPVTLLGTYEILPKGKHLIAPEKAVAQIVFHPPISPQDFPDRDALIAAVRDSIASALPEDRR